MCVNIDFFAINIFQPKRELTLVNIFFFRAMLGKHKCGLTFTSETTNSNNNTEES